MDRHEFLDEYFIKMYKKFGISRVNYADGALELDETDIRRMVFKSDNFSRDYDTLLDHCKAVYGNLRRGFLIRIKKDMSNNYFVTVL